KDELLDAVWPDTHVVEHVLKVRVQELRVALGDEAERPRYIETVHRRGYRFIAAVRVVSNEPVPATATSAAPGTMLVGRDLEIRRLDEPHASARSGRRQIVFVSGEAGIGKTALVDAMVARLAADDVYLGRGQCLEHHGGGEAYLPVLDAVGDLARG